VVAEVDLDDLALGKTLDIELPQEQCYFAPNRKHHAAEATGPPARSR
jgi:hypothetical protein